MLHTVLSMHACVYVSLPVNETGGLAHSVADSLA